VNESAFDRGEPIFVLLYNLITDDRSLAIFDQVFSTPRQCATLARFVGDEYDPYVKSTSDSFTTSIHLTVSVCVCVCIMRQP
jgi:hypothetical protein